MDKTEGLFWRRTSKNAGCRARHNPHKCEIVSVATPETLGTTQVFPGKNRLLRLFAAR